MANRCLRCTGHALSPAQPGCPGIEQSHTIVLGSQTKSDVLNVAHLAKGAGSRGSRRAKPVGDERDGTSQQPWSRVVAGTNCDGHGFINIAVGPSPKGMLNVCHSDL